jgi:hypothetical protein
MHSAQMMKSTQRGQILRLITTAIRAEPDVVHVQVLPRRTIRKYTPPVVAIQHRVVLLFPSRPPAHERVIDHRLEGLRLAG